MLYALLGLVGDYKLNYKLIITSSESIVFKYLRYFSNNLSISYNFSSFLGLFDWFLALYSA